MPSCDNEDVLHEADVEEKSNVIQIWAVSSAKPSPLPSARARLTAETFKFLARLHCDSFEIIQI